MLIDRLRQLDAHGVAADSETWLIVPGNLVPRIVLGSFSALTDEAEINGVLVTRDEFLETFIQLLDDPAKTLVLANGAFDLAVIIKFAASKGIDLIPKVFKMLMGEHTEHMDGRHDGRMLDIQHFQTVDAIANGHLGKDPRTQEPLDGRYSQDNCIRLLFADDSAKANDEYRLRYGEFDGWDLKDLPEKAKIYPVDDTNYCFKAGLAQVGLIPRLAKNHNWGPGGACIECGQHGFSTDCWVKKMMLNGWDLAHQTASAFCTHLGAAQGFRIDQTYVDIIEAHSLKNREEGAGPFIEAGIIRADGTENRSELKRRVAVAYGSDGTCPTCQGTGKVPSPANKKSKIICFEMAADGETRLKSCDGTGLVLHSNVPRSDKGGIGYGRSYLIESGDEFLMAYASYIEDAKVLAVYVPYLRTARECLGIASDGQPCRAHGTEKFPHKEGCNQPGYKGIPLNARINPILETGRISIEGALMLLPRATGKMVNDHGKFEIVEVPDDYQLQPGEEKVN